MTHWLTNYSKIFSAKSQLIEWLITFEILFTVSGNSDLDNEIKMLPLPVGDRRTKSRFTVFAPRLTKQSRTIWTVHWSISVSRASSGPIWVSTDGYPVRIWFDRSSSLFEVTETYFNDEWQSIKTSALWMTAIALLIDKMVPPCIKWAHVRSNRTIRDQRTAISFGCLRLFQPNYIFYFIIFIL